MYAEGAKVEFTVTESLMIPRPYRKSRKQTDAYQKVEAGTVATVHNNFYGVQMVVVVTLDDGTPVFAPLDHVKPTGE